MPKIDISSIPVRATSDYPAEFRGIVEGRERQRLGDAGGLTQFGVNLCRLRPGAATSQRHWQETEDEFVFVVAGEVTLIEDEGETILKPGDAAAFKAGVANGHHLVNRSGADALVLEIGSRHRDERAVYSDIDLLHVCEDGVGRYVHRDGTPYPAAETDR